MSADPPTDTLPPSAQAAAPTESGAASSALPADILAEVEREQALADLQAALKAREEDVAKIRAEKDALVAERDGAVSVTNQLRSQLATLQSTHLQSASELSVIHTRIEAADREKRELLEEIQRLKERSATSNQQLSDLRSQKLEAAQRIARLDVEASEQRMAADSAKFNEERSVLALKNARAEIAGLTKAADSTQDRFRLYRVQAQNELSQVQMENEALQSKNTGLESTNSTLKRAFEQQGARLAAAEAEIATLKSSSKSIERSFRIELDGLGEENRLLQRREQEARARVEDREAEIERLSENVKESDSKWEEQCKREEAARKRAEKKADDYKVTVERLTMAGGFGNDISPSAALAAKQRENGKSYTQIFAEHTMLEQELRNRDEEIQRLRDLLDQVTREIQEKKPLLDQQWKEREEAIHRANTLAEELAATSKARDESDQRARAAEAKAGHDSEDATSLRALAQDLSTQVQALTREIAIRDDPNLAYETMDESARVKDGDLITDRLLLFKSLPALQEQNARLLKVTRALTRRAAEGGVDAATIESTIELTQRQTAAIQELQKKLMEITRERDMFSNLLARGEGLRWSNDVSVSAQGPLQDDHEEAMAALQAELESIRAKADADVDEAKRLALEKSQAAADADAKSARAEATSELLNSQIRTLTDTHALQKQQYEALESEVRLLKGQVTQKQTECRIAQEKVAEHEAAEKRLHNEAALLRLEKDQWESVQSRLQNDLGKVQEERVRLQLLIDNLNNVNAEHERARGEERTKHEQRIEELQREAANLRNQVDQAREATRAAEKRVEESDSRIASETAAIRTEKEAAEAQVATKTAEIATLNDQVGEAKRIGLNWQRRARELQQQIAEATTTNKTAVEAKEAEIADIKAQLDTASAKVTELEAKITEAQNAAQLKDSTVTRLQDELAKAQEAAQAAAQAATPATTEPGPDAAQLTALQAERDSLQQRLTQAEKDLAAAKAAPAPATTEAPKDAAADTELQGKLDEANEKLRELDERYERNVTKVNKANKNLMNNLNSLKEAKAATDKRIAELEKEISDLKEKLATATAAGASSSGDASNGTAQPDVDAAVKAAVSKREAELATEHATALAAQAASKPDDATIAAAVMKRETELKVEHDKQLAEAKAAASAATAEGSPADKATVEALQAQVKTLERRLKTAEITRKTLERQKADVETKLKAANGGGAAPSASPATSPATTASPATTTAPALSAKAAPFTPTPAAAAGTTAAAPTTKAALPAKPTPAVATSSSAAATPAAKTPPATTPTESTPVRGAARGRGRVSVRGRGGAARPNSVLSAVNATLAEGGTKRPAPDDGDAPAAGGDILARIQSASAADAPVTRAAKRARGGARGGRGGGAAGRRPSAAGEGDGA